MLLSTIRQLILARLFFFLRAFFIALVRFLAYYFLIRVLLVYIFVTFFRIGFVFIFVIAQLFFVPVLLLGHLGAFRALDLTVVRARLLVLVLLLGLLGLL